MDDSPHGWFEGEQRHVLLVFIDDATGKLVHLQSVDNESFFNYAQVVEN